MFGNLVTNHQLKILLNSNKINIEPFNDENLKTSHYTLHVGRIYKKNANGDPELIHIFSDSKESTAFKLKANEYIIVEPAEVIKIHSLAIVGRFITASSLIEKGLGLVSGQIDSTYGANGEVLRFGLKNYMSDICFIEKDFRLAHVEFFDLRGVMIDSVKMTKEENKIWLNRKMRASDDGVNYDTDG